jgi:type IV secretion/conjugal transfer VirB4 family ATPase
VIPLRRLLRDYHDAATVSELVGLWGFVDETTFLTKSGAVGQVLRLDGVDGECLDHAERREVALQMERVLRSLDERTRLYQYLIKSRLPIASAPSTHPSSADQSLYELQLVLVLTHEPAPVHGRFVRSLSVARTADRLAGWLGEAVAQLTDQVRGATALLGDALRPEVLQKQKAFEVFRRLINLDPDKVQVPLKYDTHLDFFASDSTLDCYRDRLDIGGESVKVLTMKDPPRRTCAALLYDIADVPSSFVACLEWQTIPTSRIRREIHARRRHHFNRRISLVNYISPQTKPEEMLVDDSATATVRELGESLTALEVNGHVFGATSFTLVVHDRDQPHTVRAASEAAKVFAGHDGALYEESYNLLNAWLAVVPGNAHCNVRRLALLNINTADLSLLFTHAAGEATNAHLKAPCLAVLETTHQTPYRWNLHQHDVGHTLIQGATGSGKSFLCNFLLASAQKYEPFGVVFDLGGSYDGLVRSLGGSSWKVGIAHREFAINPFCLEPTKENLHFLFSFVRVLIQSTGQHQLSLPEDRDLYDAVENLYALDPPHRRLLTLSNLLPRSLSQHLHRWVQGGPYAALFDNERDTLTLQRLQAFDFEGLEKFPMLLEPLLFYVLHRASASIQDRATDSRLKLFVLDEAWRFARDPIVKAYITEALKTWRKRNAAMVLATQSGEDFLDADLLRTVIESCPTKIFLSNPGIDLTRARELFHLNYTEAETIQRLVPRRQLLIKTPSLAKVLNLVVPPDMARLFSNRSTLTEPAGPVD